MKRHLAKATVLALSPRVSDIAPSREFIVTCSHYTSFLLVRLRSMRSRHVWLAYAGPRTGYTPRK